MSKSQVTCTPVPAEFKRRVVTREEWLAEGQRLWGPDARKWRFVCPMCHTAQSAEDFYAAGFKRGTGDVNKYLGFSCIGRFTGAGPHNPDAAPGRGCDWTLGGLFQIHELEVVDEEGKHHPRFEFAQPSLHQGSEGNEGCEIPKEAA